MVILETIALLLAQKKAGDIGEGLAKKIGIRKYLAIMLTLMTVVVGVMLYIKFFVWCY